jgi:hypothetical protein
MGRIKAGITPQIPSDQKKDSENKCGFIRDLLAARDKIQEETQGSATSLNVSDLGVQMKVLIR